ncbi:MAG: acyltransferase [Bacteroidales bacterium]|nr:acyltransferase [Bacteroidales bacterium]
MKKLFNIPIRIYQALSYAYDEFIKNQQNLYKVNQFAHFGENSYIYPKVTISHPERVVIGKGCTIQGGSIFHTVGGLHLGNYVGIGRDTIILTSIHNYFSSKSIPFDNNILLKPVIIRDFAWIGWRSIILPGLEIGEGSIIGSGSVVTKNIPPLTIVMGNPAEVIGKRSKDHYEKCKSENRVNSHRILEKFGKYVEKVPVMIKRKYEKELQEIGLI